MVNNVIIRLQINGSNFFLSYLNWAVLYFNVLFFFIERVEKRMEEIVQLWETLVSATEKKGSKLQEASQQQQFNRTVEDIELWLSEIEGQLLSEDYGKVNCHTILPLGSCRSVCGTNEILCYRTWPVFRICRRSMPCSKRMLVLIRTVSKLLRSLPTNLLIGAILILTTLELNRYVLFC